MPVPIRLREDRGVLPAVLDRDPARGPALSDHRPEQVGPGRGERVARPVGDRPGSSSAVGRVAPSSSDQSAQRPAVAEAVEGPGHQGEVDRLGGLAPGAEGARRPRSPRPPRSTTRARRIPSRGSTPRRWWPGASASRRPSSDRGSRRRRCGAGGPRRSASPRPPAPGPPGSSPRSRGRSRRPARSRGRGASGSIRISSALVRLRRSASGSTRNRPRSSGRTSIEALPLRDQRPSR